MILNSTTRKGNREIKINSDFRRVVTEQACINQALSMIIEEIEEHRQTLKVQLRGRQKGFICVLGEKVHFPKPRVGEERGVMRPETYEISPITIARIMFINGAG